MGMAEEREAGAYERLEHWARTADLDEREAAALALFPVPELEREWTAGPALRVGPGRGWSSCRKMIRALDAALLEQDARRELLDHRKRSCFMMNDRAARLERAVSAFERVRSPARMEALWRGALEEIKEGRERLLGWALPPERALLEERLMDCLEAMASGAQGFWSEAAGWLDALTVNPERAVEALSIIEKEELSTMASAVSVEKGRL